MWVTVSRRRRPPLLQHGAGSARCGRAGCRARRPAGRRSGRSRCRSRSARTCGSSAWLRAKSGIGELVGGELGAARTAPIRPGLSTPCGSNAAFTRALSAASAAVERLERRAPPRRRYSVAWPPAARAAARTAAGIAHGQPRPGRRPSRRAPRRRAAAPMRQPAAGGTETPPQRPRVLWNASTSRTWPQNSARAGGVQQLRRGRTFSAAASASARAATEASKPSSRSAVTAISPFSGGARRPRTAGARRRRHRPARSGRASSPARRARRRGRSSSRVSSVAGRGSTLMVTSVITASVPHEPGHQLQRS